MSKITALPVWKQLQQAKAQIQSLRLRDLFARDEKRFERFSAESCGLLLDYSKNHLTESIFSELMALARQANLADKIDALFSGRAVNHTENRPALHSALRRPPRQPLTLHGRDIMPEIAAAQKKTAAFIQRIHQRQRRGFSGQAFTDIVNIGIGGSHLGPEFITEALADYKIFELNFHFISNVDDYPLCRLLRTLNPATTLWIVSSKSFGTLETRINLQTARKWLNTALGDETAWLSHFIAVTANPDKAYAMGFTADQIFPLWDWVGGRYSAWSNVGLPIMLSIGMDHFNAFLAGAHAMDEHFQNQPFEKNLPVILALLDIWYRNFWHTASHAVIPYLHKLEKFPRYLQQLIMESNGKSVDQNSEIVTYGTAPVIWGESGTNCQHSFMQLLHQGYDTIPVDFIIASLEGEITEHRDTLLANALSQSQVLMQGKTETEAYQELLASGVSAASARRLAPHKALPGNRPSNTLLFEKLDPYTLGALISLYEHRVSASAFLWNINAFDQWGVESGKIMAGRILKDLQNKHSPLKYDASTRSLIQQIRLKHSYE